MDPAEFRRLNFIPKDAFPYQTAVALQYDVGDYEPLLDKALEMIDYKGFEQRRAESWKMANIAVLAYPAILRPVALRHLRLLARLAGVLAS